MKWLIFFLICGCAQVTSLNMKKHEFGLVPTKIIWFQIAGLDEEHAAILRFHFPAERRTAFEDSTCVGRSWNYNLYELRPDAAGTFISQLTGRKNIKKTCEDTTLRPIWNYVAGSGYNSGILESGTKSSESLLNLKNCGTDGENFLKDLFFWSRQMPEKGAATFHYSEDILLNNKMVFYDRSCNKLECFSSISQDFKSVYEAFRRMSQKHLFIIRDFSYLHALESKNLSLAKQILSDIEKALAEAIKFSDESSDYLVLLTTGDSKIINFPPKGKSWEDIEKNKTMPELERGSLSGFVAANGSRAENFCGIYEDSQILERILSGPKQLGLELKFINPFK
jgi:hypothetical protein